MKQPKSRWMVAARQSSRFVARPAADFRGWPGSRTFSAPSGLKSVPATGWQSEQNSALNTADWTEVATPAQEINGRMEVTIGHVIGSRFYRLHKP